MFAQQAVQLSVPIWQDPQRRGSPENLFLERQPLDREDVSWWAIVTQGASILIETVRGQRIVLGWDRGRRLGLVA